MNILFVVDYYQPEIGYGSYYIPRELAKSGHKVTILTSNYYYPFPNYNETAGKILGPRRLKPGTNLSNGVRVVRQHMWFEIFTRAFFGGHLQALRRYKPSIVIVDKTAGYSQVLMCLFKHAYNYRLISIDAHLPSGFVAEGNLLAKNLFYWFFRFFFSGIVNKNVDKFIAVQEETKSIMKKYYGIKGKIVDIPLGTDIDVFRFSKKQRLKVRKDFGIGAGDFVVIYTGKIIVEKGVHLLFEAMDKLCKNNKNLKLLLVGSGTKEYLDSCYSKISPKYKKNIIEAGFVVARDLPKFYSASDLAVWPLQESMSMNDAAACCLPFIANNKIGAKFRIKNDNALLYKKGNSDDLAEKIGYLYRNKTLAKEMGNRGRHLMEKDLSWKKIAARYIS